MGSTTIAALIIIAVHLLVCMTLCLLHHVGVLKSMDCCSRSWR